MSTRKIDNFLAKHQPPHSPLKKLLNRADSRDSWTAEFMALLPPNLASQCQVTDVKGPVLLVSCRSAAIATRLRFLLPELLPQLQSLSHFSHLTDIQVRVAQL